MTDTRGHQVNTNEDLRARLPDGWTIVTDALGYRIARDASGNDIIKSFRANDEALFLDSVVAALARQEEGREAVGILCGTSNGRLKALQRGLALARKWSNGTGVHDHTDTVVRRIAEEFRVALSSQEGDYTHPATPIAALAPHSGGDRDGYVVVGWQRRWRPECVPKRGGYMERDWGDIPETLYNTEPDRFEYRHVYARTEALS